MQKQSGTYVKLKITGRRLSRSRPDKIQSVQDIRHLYNSTPALTTDRRLPVNHQLYIRMTVKLGAEGLGGGERLLALTLDIRARRLSSDVTKPNGRRGSFWRRIDGGGELSRWVANMGHQSSACQRDGVNSACPARSTKHSDIAKCHPPRSSPPHLARDGSALGLRALYDVLVSADERGTERHGFGVGRKNDEQQEHSIERRPRPRRI